jgi:hypothetical protein
LTKRTHEEIVGNIPQLTLPADLNPTEPQDLIVVTDGSALFDVGYHIWMVSTKYEEIIISGGGPDDGAPHQMTSYRSELGGICHSVDIKTIAIHVIEVIISITTIITYLYNYI